MNRQDYNAHHSGGAHGTSCFRRKPIAWLVSSLFMLTGLSMAEVVRAQTDPVVKMSSHRSVLDWATDGNNKASDAAKAAEARRLEKAQQVADALKADEARHRAEKARVTEEARLANAAQADEQVRLAAAAQATEQARLAATAKADEDRRLAQEAQTAQSAALLEAAKLAEAKRIDEEAAKLEATRVAQAQHATAIAQAAESKRLAEAAHAAEAKRVAEAAHAAEIKRLADAAQVANEKRLADAAKAAEALRLAEAKQVAKTKPVAAAAKGVSPEPAAGGNDILAFVPEGPATAPVASSTASPAATSAQPASGHGSGDKATSGWNFAPARPAQPKQDDRPDLPPIVSTTDASPVLNAPTPAPAPTSLPASKSVSLLSLQAQGKAPVEATGAANKAPVTVPALAPRDVTPPPGPALPNAPKAIADKAAGSFARWLEEQPDTFGAGPTPTEAQLREIFHAAVTAAADRSPAVRLAYANYQAAQADVDQVKGERWPQVDVGTQSPGVQFGPGAGNGANRSAAATVNITTNVFDWGRTSKTIGSREYTAEAAREIYAAELENSAYEVTTTLVELGKQRLIVDLSRQYVERMQALVTMLGEIVAVDRGRGSELTQAKTRLLQAQAARDAADAKVRDGELNLRKLVGDDAVPIPRTRIWTLQPGNLAQLLAEVNGHPGIAQAQAEANAADLNADAVKASGRPQVNWVVSAGTGRDELGRRQPWQTMLTLNWGAFRGGSQKAAYSAANSRAAASWQKIEQQRRDLEFGIRGADQDARTFLERADLYHNLSGETDRVRKAFFEQWYHLGKRTLLDVLTAESEHYGNRVNEVTSRFDGYQAVFREHAQAGALVRWLGSGS